MATSARSALVKLDGVWWSWWVDGVECGSPVGCSTREEGEPRLRGKGRRRGGGWRGRGGRRRASDGGWRRRGQDGKSDGQDDKRKEGGRKEGCMYFSWYAGFGRGRRSSLLYQHSTTDTLLTLTLTLTFSLSSSLAGRGGWGAILPLTLLLLAGCCRSWSWLVFSSSSSSSRPPPALTQSITANSPGLVDPTIRLESRAVEGYLLASSNNNNNSISRGTRSRSFGVRFLRLAHCTCMLDARPYPPPTPHHHPARVAVFPHPPYPKSSGTFGFKGTLLAFHRLSPTARPRIILVSEQGLSPLAIIAI